EVAVEAVVLLIDDDDVLDLGRLAAGPWGVPGECKQQRDGDPRQHEQRAELAGGWNQRTRRLVLHSFDSCLLVTGDPYWSLGRERLVLLGSEPDRTKAWAVAPCSGG